MVYPCMCGFRKDCPHCQGSGVRKDKDPNLLAELRQTEAYLKTRLARLAATISAVEAYLKTGLAQLAATISAVEANELDSAEEACRRPEGDLTAPVERKEPAESEEHKAEPSPADVAPAAPEQKESGAARDASTPEPFGAASRLGVRRRELP